MSAGAPQDFTKRQKDRRPSGRNGSAPDQHQFDQDVGASRNPAAGPRLDQTLNADGLPHSTSIARDGEGVLEATHGVMKLLLKSAFAEQGTGEA
jgi:hypothetical protein